MIKLLAIFALLGAAVPVAAQDPAVVEALAPLLMAEDRRAYDGALFGRGAVHPDGAVRRATALAIGRIGNPDGVALVVPLLSSPDRDVHADAFFALGMLRDSSAVQAIIRRLRAPDSSGGGGLRSSHRAGQDRPR